MSEDDYSKRDLLRLGRKRVQQSVALGAEYVLDNFADRFTPRVQRPPGALPELEFLLACTRCGDCIRSCPVAAILTLDDGAGASAGTPFLDVNKFRPCVACDDAPCMPACPTDALRVIDIKDAVMGTAHVDREVCIEWLGGTCDRCIKACPYPDDALLVDEEGRPYIDPRHCIGCGMCVAVCPTSPIALSVSPPGRF
ncbi:MAG: ferredoxin-type protein NapG [Bradymonadia bacterium]|jgi:ferredoxin-type protein NapG